MFPRKFFTLTLACALIALCFLSSGCAKKEKGFITEQQVNALMEEIERAANNKDVDAIIALMSKDVQLKITVEGFGPPQTMTLDREQYRTQSKQSLGMTDVYNYRRGETVINVEPDGQSAVVVADVYETTTLGKQTIGTVSRETSILGLEDGKLVITRGEAITRPLPSVKKSRPAVF
jgi:ketosteroid isomerase-like protein